ncbi:MAG: hydantoinase/oxoprolinase family protein, partial [Chloroflexi bacterium]|nr:hydantoinase/oxoprolinase family protein [Chloroflexota bacterium]
HLGLDDLITFDMGGTSTDVSLCPGHIQETSEASIGGAPIRVPVIDIHTVGAGGGSIGRVDAAGALAVGPESAGANPGPVCYGRGEELTVTDANLLLGRLQPDYFLGGRMPLDLERSRERMDRLAAELGREPAGAAWGIVRVANSNMENAIRVISVQRGYDPRDFTLVAFGGAGPLHACELAQELRIPRVLVPLYPGVLSALGMLVADVVKDYARTVMLPSASATAERLDEVFGPLEERGWADLRAERFPDERIRPQRFADIRYVGQSFELRVPLDDDSGEGFESRFHTLHQQRFGHADSRLPTEIVTVRLKVLGLVEPPRFEAASLEGADASAARIDERPVYFDAGYRPTWLYDRERLRPGNEITGPAIVVQTDTTSVIPPGWDASVDAFRNLVVDFRKGSR